MITTTEAILETLSKPMGKNEAVKLSLFCVSNETALRYLYKCCFHPDATVCFRATWAIETTALRNLSVFEPILDEFVGNFKAFKHVSCLRHVSRVIILLNKEKANAPIKDTYLKLDLQEVSYILFEWLVEPDIPVAVKANCMEALAGLAFRFPEIKDELLETIEYLRDRESIAFFARAKRILPLLK